MKGGEWRFYVACVFIYFAYSVHLQVIPEVVRMLVCEEELGADWQRADCKTDDGVTRVTSSWLPLVMGSYYLGEVLVAGLLAHYVDIGRHRFVSLVSCLALALQAGDRVDGRWRVDLVKVLRLAVAAECRDIHEIVVTFLLL